MSERRTYARPRTFDVECPNCGRLHIVARPHHSTEAWDHRHSRLTCRCGKGWIVGLALWHPGPAPSKRAGRPLDQIPARGTLQQLRGIVAAGKAERQTDGAIRGQYRRSLVIVERELVCTCEYLPRPLQHVRKAGSVAGCAIHGEGGSE